MRKIKDGRRVESRSWEGENLQCLDPDRVNVQRSTLNLEP